jgi:hypothetical protein
MTGWAASELQYADLGDTRRNKRLVRLVEDLAAQPNASVPQASGERVQLKVVVAVKRSQQSESASRYPNHHWHATL